MRFEYSSILLVVSVGLVQFDVAKSSSFLQGVSFLRVIPTSSWIKETRETVSGLPEELYSNQSLIGAGGFGSVYRADETANNRRVAIKSITKKSFGWLTGSLERLRGEIYLHLSMMHPNLVSLFNVYESPDHVYLIMELCEKGTLFEYTEQFGKLREPEVQYFMNQLVSAVKEMHDQLNVHRDIKLENILMTDENDVKLADFGLSRKLSVSNKIISNEWPGTRGYMAPELVRREPYSFKVDVFALGVVMYAMLIGQYPFTTSEDVLAGVIVIPKFVPEAAADLIRRMMDPNPETRYDIDQVLSHSWWLNEHLIADIPVPLRLASGGRRVSSKGSNHSQKSIVFEVDEDEISRLTSTVVEEPATTVDADWSSVPAVLVRPSVPKKFSRKLIVTEDTEDGCYGLPTNTVV